ncbi:TPA: hypothetical protein EYP66_10810 [Candidatus Poribacteria bacterium]|nr:hypothetical protein [Candidatus Poribacteria bacterium]
MTIRIEEEDVQFEKIRHGGLTRNNVWKVQSADGKKSVVKQFIVPPPKQHNRKEQSPEVRYSQTAVEANILKLLKREGCPVPDVIASNESTQIIVLEWCGDTTWDDLCQDETIVDKKRYTRLAIEGFCRIERVFSEKAGLVEPYVYPLDYKSHLYQIGEKLLTSARRCISDLAWIRDEPLTESETKIVDESWDEISHCILERQSTLGTLDYNARNIIIDRNRLTFIDFAKIGWDWPERRLMQYLTGLGAHIEGGNFTTLLDAEHTGLYAEIMSRIDVTLNWQKLAALVDYHHILFYLTAIIRLLRLLKNPEIRQSILLSRAWGPVKPRMTRALFNLAHKSLSHDEAAAAIRNLFLSFADKIKF